MTTTAPDEVTLTAAAPADGAPGAAAARASAALERSLTQVARAMLRLQVPPGVLPGGVTLTRSGHWVLARLSDSAPARLSEVAEALGLDISTVSRQVRDLVAAGLMAKVPDPADGRASLLSLTREGEAVLEAVSASRREALAVAVAEWTDDERAVLAHGLLRLGADMEGVAGRPADHHREDDRDDEGTR